MTTIAKSRRNCFWFGTEERSQFIQTPNRGADVSPLGWSAGGALLNGGGFQQGSFGSHRVYNFEWPQSSAREAAQLMQSYASGTYGRGLIYFQDPLTFSTNVLPSMWADPSIGVGYEGSSLVYGLDPSSVPTSGWETNELPVNSAYYNLSDTPSGWRGKEDSVFVPIPDGFSLLLGAVYSATGTGAVYYRTQSTSGALGPLTVLNPLTASSAVMANTLIPGSGLAGIRIQVGRTSNVASTITLSAMVGRLVESGKTTEIVARNVFTNPSFEAASGTVEVYRNLFTNPRLVGNGTYSEVWRNLFADPNPTNGSMWVRNGTNGGANIATATGVSIPELNNLGVVNTRRSTGGTPPAGYGIGALVESLTIGQVYTALLWSAHTSIPRQLRATDSTGGTSIAVGGSWAGAGSGWRSVTFTATETSHRILAFTTAATTQASDVFDVSACCIVAGSVAPPSFFSGSTPTGAADPDMRQRWLGTSGASQSVMEGEIARNIGTSGPVVAIRTSLGQIRLIRTGDGNAFARTSFYARSATNTGLIRRVSYSSASGNAPAVPQLYDFSLNLNWFNLTDQGNGLYRGTADVSTWASTLCLLFRTGGSVRDEAIYDALGIYAGDYRGPFFTVDVPYPDSDLTTSWVGAEDNSETRVTAPAIPSAVGGGGRTIYQSQQWAAEGSKSLAIRSTALNSNSALGASVRNFSTGELGRPWTIVAICHIPPGYDPSTDAVLSDRVSRGIYLYLNTAAGYAQAPSTPGTYELRLTVTPTNVTDAVRLGGGGAIDQVVRWDLLTIVDGVYDGPPFSGSTPSANSVYYNWEGAANASPSVAEKRYPSYLKALSDPWIGGQGNSGCRFVGHTNLVKNSGVNGGQVGYGAVFREVGHWLYG